ncbi:MAG: hypothetical protein IPL35_16930 [Sphingobacteriales bacterium]|nr:hypothetical protein [Sphingobacteriales bacterium]
MKKLILSLMLGGIVLTLGSSNVSAQAERTKANVVLPTKEQKTAGKKSVETTSVSPKKQQKANPVVTVLPVNAKASRCAVTSLPNSVGTTTIPTKRIFSNEYFTLSEYNALDANRKEKMKNDAAVYVYPDGLSLEEAVLQRKQGVKSLITSPSK